jgi:hypothetical protein
MGSIPRLKMAYKKKQSFFEAPKTSKIKFCCSTKEFGEIR